jgi:hypothetical protein
LPDRQLQNSLESTTASVSTERHYSTQPPWADLPASLRQYLMQPAWIGLPAPQPAERHHSTQPSWAGLPGSRLVVHEHHLGRGWQHEWTRHGWVGERGARAPERSGVSAGDQRYCGRLERLHPATSRSRGVATRQPLHLGLSNYPQSARPLGSIHGYPCAPAWCRRSGGVLRGRLHRLHWLRPLTNRRPRMRR